jgi:AraC-like DNA-binding protein
MRAVEFVSSYIAAWNDHDARCVADHLSIDGIYYDVPSQEHHPKPELVAYLADFFNHDHNHYTLQGDIITGENAIAFQYKVEQESCDAQNVCWFGAEFVTLEGDQAVQIADYYKEPATLLDNDSTDKYAKSGLNDAQLDKYKDELTKLMLDEKAYLNSALTLPKLSTLVNCPVNHLSQVINAGFGMSFFDYLNSYRVDEAKRILRRGTYPPPVILTVAFEVGFNSNSAFYSAFKRSSGQTPAQYRRACSGIDSV